jgi:hypothetical protein
MTPTAVHADGEVHETDISWLGPGVGVGVGVTVQLGAAAQPALAAPSESAKHAPATQLERTRTVRRQNWSFARRPLHHAPMRAVNARRRETSPTMGPRRQHGRRDTNRPRDRAPHLEQKPLGALIPVVMPPRQEQSATSG